MGAVFDYVIKLLTSYTNLSTEKDLTDFLLKCRLGKIM